jgi:hypothetical protein
LIRDFAFGRIALQDISASNAKMGQGTDAVQPNAAMVNDSLELTNGRAAIICRQVGFAAQVNWIKIRCVAAFTIARDSQFPGRSSLKPLDCLQRIVMTQSDPGVYGWKLFEPDNRVFWIPLTQGISQRLGAACVAWPCRHKRGFVLNFPAARKLERRSDSLSALGGFMAHPDSRQTFDTRSSLVFRRNGTRNYLSQVWVAGTRTYSEMGAQRKLSRELETSKPTPESVVELALK